MASSGPSSLANGLLSIVNPWPVKTFLGNQCCNSYGYCA